MSRPRPKSNAPSPVQATPQAAPASASVGAVTINVSIVEDDAEARELLADWLNSTPGFHCLSEHADGSSALEQLPGVRPDIVLMDINLPGLNGIECVRQLKGLMPTTQFLMLTVYGDTHSIFQALEAGATGYLLKRTSREELFAALRLVQAGGSPISSGIARRVAQAFQKNQTTPGGDEALSGRERQVLDLLARGHPEKQIAEQLSLSQHTVHTYIRRIYEKLQVHSHAQAVAKYAERAPS